MDILDPLEKILDITMALKSLVEIFKSKDKWFETCYTYFGSIIETMTKYKENRNPQSKIPTACILLQGELESFKDFLEKEKKRPSNIMSFFRGSSMVKEAQELQLSIEKQIHNFNLALNVDNQIENNENFKKMISFGGHPGSNLRTLFKNATAADMWIFNFFQDEQVSWSSFSIAMNNFVLSSEKFKLSEMELEVIMTSLDADHDRLISYDEWDKFYEDIWSKLGKKQDLLKSKPPAIEKKCLIKIPPLLLRVTQVNSDDPKKLMYPLNHEFFISEEMITFQNYEGKEVNVPKNWQKEALILGKIKPTVFMPDIYYNQKVSSVKDKQFQIVLKKMLNSKGFFLNNLSASSPTCLVIEQKPYVIGTQMIFDLAETLIEIVEIEPEPNPDIDEDSPDYFFISFQAKNNDDEEKSNDATIKRPRKKKKTDNDDDKKVRRPVKKPAGPPPSITLKIIQGIDQKKEAITFILKDKNDKKVIRIGSNDNNEVVVKDLEDVQLMIKWDELLNCWTAFSEKKKGEFGGAYLYLIPSDEYMNKNLKQGKLSVKLRDKMKVAFGYNELEVNIK